MAVSEGILDKFMGQFVHDFGAVMHAATIVVGGQLGLHNALAEGPATALELASRTQTDPRYLREWLSAQAASAYVCYDPKGKRFSLSEEQAFALADVGCACGHVCSLKPNGSWMLVEPFANDRREDKLNPVGRVFFSASTFICAPASRAQEVGLCLGVQAGEARIRDVVTQGGFTHFRRAAQTPFNLVYEARP